MCWTLQVSISALFAGDPDIMIFIDAMNRVYPRKKEKFFQVTLQGWGDSPRVGVPSKGGGALFDLAQVYDLHTGEFLGIEQENVVGDIARGVHAGYRIGIPVPVLLKNLGRHQ